MLNDIALLEIMDNPQSAEYYKLRAINGTGYCHCMGTHTYQRIDYRTWRCDKCGQLAASECAKEFDDEYDK